MKRILFLLTMMICAHCANVVLASASMYATYHPHGANVEPCHLQIIDAGTNPDLQQLDFRLSPHSTPYFNSTSKITQNELHGLDYQNAFKVSDISDGCRANTIQSEIDNTRPECGGRCYDRKEGYCQRACNDYSSNGYRRGRIFHFLELGRHKVLVQPDVRRAWANACRRTYYQEPE